MSGLSALALTRKWRDLGWDERAGLAEAVLAVPAMALSLRVFGFSRVRGWVDRTSARPAVRPPTPADAVRVSVVSVNRVKQYSAFRGNCLSQSLALTWLLRRRGLSPALQLGVRLTGPQLDAHAWVEFEGRVLNDTQDVHSRFTPLTAKPGIAPRPSND